MPAASSLVVAATLLVLQAPAPSPAPSSSTASSLDFEFYRTRVQPILFAKRPGGVRCVTCHARVANSQLRLQPLAPGATSWSLEDERANFEALSRFVVPGEPAASRLLMHPLERAAGGDPFHGGGKPWRSQSDPEWQTLAAWARTGPAAAPTAPSRLDFQFYRARIEPLFLKPRVGLVGIAACVSCHSSVASRLRLEPPAASNTWSEEQSRRNFEVVARLVTPGEPLKSRLLLHPLAPEAGGDPSHTGGKLWNNQQDPEWQTLAAWVRGQTGEKQR